MARPFSAKDAKRLISAHQRLKTDLTAADTYAARYRYEVSAACEALAAQEVTDVLKNIPIDELNRDGHGFRIKTLRDHGYNTIADISAASVYTIAAIDGISNEAALVIKRVLGDIISKASRETKIRLSSDDKTPAATQLVTALSKYRGCLPHAEACHKLLAENGPRIDAAVRQLSSSAGSVSWLFTSADGRQRAAEAYDMLNGLLTSGYGQSAAAVLSALDSVRRRTGQSAWEDFSVNSVQFFSTLEQIAPGILGTDSSVYGLPEKLASDIREESFSSDGLLCTLRRYQEWGVRYILHQQRVLLGDEMGLGKTIQAIAAMVSLRNAGASHFAVVCPASVLTNWCREIHKMSTLDAVKIHGDDRSSAAELWLKNGGVAVTTYETTEFITLPEDFTFTMLVVDEAHYIKNPETQRTANVKKLCTHAQRLLFMTGTALENRVDEMIALISMLQPDVASQVNAMAFMAAAPQFREKIAPVYYRRRREDVLTELPELTESKEWCSLLPEEERIYENAVLGKRYADARRVSWSVDDMSASCKANRLLEIVEEAESESRKVIVFSFFLDTIRRVTALLGDRCTEPINGSVPPQHRQEIVDGFDRAPAGAVLPAQIQSGGTGLNIQSASVIVLCEPQLKPSTENQAISRAYRMGQTRNVLVYRLLCENTVDERITALLDEKQAVFDAFADTSVAALESLELDEKTLGGIMDGELARINAKHPAPAAADADTVA